MKEIERVIIIGTGAVGSAVASIIHRAEPEVLYVLAEGERYDRYIREGFLVNGKQYHFRILGPKKHPGEEVPDSRNTKAADLIIVAVKHHHLPQAISLMESYVGPETTVLSLLNGISSEEILGKHFGSGPGAPQGCSIPPYAMIIGIDAVRIGNDTRFASSGKIFFGETTNTQEVPSPRVARIARFFDRVGIAYTIPEDMLKDLWYKFMINVGINQASAVLRAPYRLFQTQGDARSIMEDLQREVVALSQAVGVHLSDADLERWEETLSKLHPDNLTSMCQDVLAGRKTEVEIFAGTVLELGKAYAIPTPVNNLFFRLLKALDPPLYAD